MVFKLIDRTACNLQETVEFSIAKPPASFSNICRYGREAAPNRRSQPEQLVFRECGGETIRLKSQSVSLLPNFQFTKIAHALSNALTNYYLLITGFPYTLFQSSHSETGPVRPRGLCP